MSTVRIRLDLADHLVRSYLSSATHAEAVRGRLAGPWAEAVAEVGWAERSAPDLLRGVSDSLRDGAADLRWRVDFIRARYLDIGPDGYVRTVVPNYDPAVGELGYRALLGVLRTAEDPAAIQRVLAELTSRGARNPAMADRLLADLGIRGIDQLLAHALPGDGSGFDPDVADRILEDLRAIIGFALTANPSAFAPLFGEGDVEDLLRVTVLLHDSRYPRGLYPTVFGWTQNLLAQPDLARAYQKMLRSPFGPYVHPGPETVAFTWLERFFYPAEVALNEVAKNADRALAFLTAPGVLDWLANPLVDVPGWTHRLDYQRWGLVLADLVAMVGDQLAELAVDPNRSTEFDSAFAKSYELLVALRDTLPSSNVHHIDELRQAVASLMSWHFGSMADQPWPLNATAGDFAGWMAQDSEAMRLLALGATMSIANEFPNVVARFAAGGGSPADVVAVESLGRIAVLLEFLTMATLRIQQASEDLSLIKHWIDVVFLAVLRVRAGSLVGGADDIDKVVRSLLTSLTVEGYGTVQPGQQPSDVRSIDELLAEMFFTFDGVGGSNDLADVRPIQIALLAEVVAQYPVGESLSGFLQGDRLAPPDPGHPDYAAFIEAFRQFTLSGTPAARAYLHLWETLSDWIMRHVGIVERVAE